MKHRIRKNKKVKAICTDLSQTPKERLMTALNSLNRLRLRNPFYDGDWRALYSAEIREAADLLDQQLSAAVDINQRAIAELADFHYLHRVTYQITNAAQLVDEIDILPMYTNPTGRFYGLMGDEVVATVHFGNDGTIVLIAQNLRTGIPPTQMELDDTGLTAEATKQVAEMYRTKPCELSMSTSDRR